MPIMNIGEYIGRGYLLVDTPNSSITKWSLQFPPAHMRVLEMNYPDLSPTLPLLESEVLAWIMQNEIKELSADSIIFPATRFYVKGKLHTSTQSKNLGYKELGFLESNQEIHYYCFIQ